MMQFARILSCAVTILLLVCPSAEAAKRKTAKVKETSTEVKIEEVGVLRNQDVRVVQKNLYLKRDHHEVGFLLSTQLFDPYAAGVMLGFDVTFNPSERVGVELMIQGGYGWGNGHWQDVTHLAESAGNQLTALGADASRQLFGGSANVVWSPIYAKLAWGTRKVVHFDIYGTLGAHGFFAQQLESDGGFRGIVGPSVGIGCKIFLSRKLALKIDIRDHISLETRKYTGKFTARNNVQMGVGLAVFTGKRN